MTDDNEIPVDTRAASKLVGLSESFLNKRRISGDGPPYIKVGRRILYWPRDLRAWLASHLRKSTSDSGHGRARA